MGCRTLQSGGTRLEGWLEGAVNTSRVGCSSDTGKQKINQSGRRLQLDVVGVILLTVSVAVRTRGHRRQDFGARRARGKTGMPCGRFSTNECFGCNRHVADQMGHVVCPLAANNRIRLSDGKEGGRRTLGDAPRRLFFGRETTVSARRLRSLADVAGLPSLLPFPDPATIATRRKRGAASLVEGGAGKEAGGKKGRLCVWLVAGRIRSWSSRLVLLCIFGLPSGEERSASSPAFTDGGIARGPCWRDVDDNPSSGPGGKTIRRCLQGWDGNRMDGNPREHVQTRRTTRRSV